MKINHVMLVLFLLNISNLYSSGAAQQQSESCKMKGMAGSQPEEVCQLKKFIMFLSDEFKSKRTLRKGSSVLLFCGKPGTGKTMATRKLLGEFQAYEESKAKKRSEKKAATDKNVTGKEEQIEGNQDNADNLTENDTDIEDENESSGRFFYDSKVVFSGSGELLASKLNEIYQTAQNVAKRERRPIIIVFDDTSAEGDTKQTLLFLNTVFDKYFDNPLITTIITSNSSVSSFNETTKSRCTIVFWEMPDVKKRAEIIKFYNQKCNGVLSDADITEYAKKYENFSCRDIAKVFQDIELAATKNHNVLLKEHIKKAFEDANSRINPYKPGFFYKLWLAITFQSY